MLPAEQGLGSGHPVAHQGVLGLKPDLQGLGPHRSSELSFEGQSPSDAGGERRHVPLDAIASSQLRPEQCRVRESGVGTAVAGVSVIREYRETDADRGVQLDA